MSAKAVPAPGWGLLVGGARPYLGFHYAYSREGILPHITEKYHKPTQVVIITKREYDRLKRIEQEATK